MAARARKAIRRSTARPRLTMIIGVYRSLRPSFSAVDPRISGTTQGPSTHSAVVRSSIGEGKWCGRATERQLSLPHPLVVSCPDAPYVDELHSEWKAEDIGELFRLEFAPDYYHKAGVSGGRPYSIELPNSSIDGLVLEEPHGLYFLLYLRLCMKWGGFPGLAGLANGIPPSHLSFLTEGLLPL